MAKDAKMAKVSNSAKPPKKNPPKQTKLVAQKQ
jgi:hypothetical protein